MIPVKPKNRSRSTRINVHDKPESSVTIRRNDWSRSPGIPNQFAFDEIRNYLRVSENLRSKRPKPEQIESELSITEQSILLDYFDGIDAKTNPKMLGKSGQYFSSVKRNIENALRIDITIPWSVHSTQISPDLPKWLVWPGEYVAPDTLVAHCFVRETVKAKLMQLRAMLSTRQATALLQQQQVPPAAPAVTGGTAPPNGAIVKTKTVTTSKRRLKPIR